MMLGFIVRRCEVTLGHPPTPQELVEWANHQAGESGPFCLFGRAISESEATVILENPARLVRIRESSILSPNRSGSVRNARMGQSSDGCDSIVPSAKGRVISLRPH
jgi:hypothetical protein